MPKALSFTKEENEPGDYIHSGITRRKAESYVTFLLCDAKDHEARTGRAVACKFEVFFDFKQTRRQGKKTDDDIQAGGGRMSLLAISIVAHIRRARL